MNKASISRNQKNKSKLIPQKNKEGNNKDGIEKNYITYEHIAENVKKSHITNREILIKFINLFLKLINEKKRKSNQNQE